MKGLLRSGLLAAVLTTVAFSGVSSVSAASTSVLPSPQTVTSWPFVPLSGSFVESMAFSGGNLYVSHTTWGETADTGAIERVPLNGGPPTPIVSGIDAGYGLLTGVAFDPQGRLYVAVAAFSDTVRTAVLRVGADGRLTPVLYLPPDAFPNGLVFSGNYLYVTDSDLGAIWRVKLGGAPVTQTVPWLRDPALAPVKAFGANGIAFRGNTLYVTQYDRGQILTSTIARDGMPGALHVFADDRALVTADGIAFDPFGNLWVTANGHYPSDSGRIVTVMPDGSVRVLADNMPWLDYPTQPVFAGPFGLYVANGSFNNGTPSVVRWPTLPF
jgi:sugar lactone lactonase YvrE